MFAALFGLQTAHAHPLERDALAELDAQLRAHPARTELHLRRAEHLLGMQQAERALQAVEASGLNSAEAQVLAAQAHLQLGHPLEARRRLDRALSLCPEHAPALVLRAEVAEAAGDLNLAASDLSRLLRGPSKVGPELYLRLARVQDALHLADAAHRTLGQGLRRTGAQVLRRAWVRSALGLGRARLARAEATALMAGSAYPMEALLLRAEAHAALGNRHEARKDRQAALRFAERAFDQRGSAAALAWRAEAKLALGDRAGAVADAQAALARAPTSLHARAVRKEASR